ncbi:unnamed protein product [Gadus morhua 'NCC']
MLLNYALDLSRPGGEMLVKEGDVCLTREDFWSLCLPRNMESNIGNACFKLVAEAARRHGKDIHVVDAYVVPTWKSETVDPMAGLPGDLLQKDLIILPAWSRQPGKADHYVLCGPSTAHCPRPVEN